jgi:hypothetical protein
VIGGDITTEAVPASRTPLLIAKVITKSVSGHGIAAMKPTVASCRCGHVREFQAPKPQPRADDAEQPTAETVKQRRAATLPSTTEIKEAIEPRSWLNDRTSETSKLRPMLKDEPVKQVASTHVL